MKFAQRFSGGKTGLVILALGIGFGLAMPLAAQSSGVASESATGVKMSADELLSRLEHNSTSASSHAIGTISVQDKFGVKVSAFETWALGNDKSIVNFTAGEEKGQKILRLGDTIYIAYPEADKPVKIQGAALRDSVAGSDMSYEDIAGDQSLASRYSATVVGHETVAGEDSAVLDLKAKKSGLAYPELKIWVSLADFSGLKIEKYSQNGRLLKSEEVSEVRLVSGRHYPVKFTIIDHLKGKSQTVFQLSKIELDLSIPQSRFGLEELTW